MQTLPRPAHVALHLAKLWWVGFVFLVRLAYHFMACVGISASVCLWAVLYTGGGPELAAAVPGWQMVVQVVLSFAFMIWVVRLFVTGRFP